MSDTEETTDATTTFQYSVAAHTYSENSDERTPGVGTEPGDSADEVDPRRLMGDPHINELRWLYRTSLAETLVDKPINDAFKNGFDIEHDGDRDPTKVLEKHEWVDHYKRVKKKSRRDGFALTFLVLEDSTDHVGQDPLEESVTVKRVKKVEAITLDDLARYQTSHGAIPAGADADPLENLDREDYEIRPTGIVMDTDPQSDTYKEPLGYLIGPPEWVNNSDAASDVKFYHANRFIHHVENDTVDGDLDDNALGRWEGDSVLVSTYHLLRGLKKGNWSLMQTIFRYAAQMYHVEMPEDADEDDFDEAEAQMQNLNAKSELITPAGYEINDFQSDGQLDPQPYFEVIFEQVCASSEMTKSVLFGTQSGTVSGSETDIKNYFNKVERMRQTQFEEDMHRFVNRVIALVDGRASVDYDLAFEVEWGPMFKLSELDNAERLSRVMQTLSAGINNFILTPAEARSVLKEEWAEASIDWTDEFTDAEIEFLESLNIAQEGGEATKKKEEMEGNPRVGQNGGGMEQGQKTASNDPSTDALDAYIAAFTADVTSQGNWTDTEAGRGLVFETKSEPFTFAGEKIQPDGSVAVVALLDGGAAVVDDSGVVAKTGQSVEMDLPEGWDRKSLLDWWESVGADFSDAENELQDERDISDEQAAKIAASFKDMALGHEGWRGENGY